jgi:hypothetical protein
MRTVDAHTAHHLFHECLKGSLMKDRTLILVSHHVQLCAPGADYIVALENGRIAYQGDRDTFQKSGGFLGTLVQSDQTQSGHAADEHKVKASVAVPTVEEELDEQDGSQRSGGSGSGDVTASEVSSTAIAAANPFAIADTKTGTKKSPRKLVEDEARAVGRISIAVWQTYVKACGRWFYWSVFGLAMGLATLAPVAERTWLTWVLAKAAAVGCVLTLTRLWARSNETGSTRSPLFYITLYATVSCLFLPDLRNASVLN